LVVYLVICLRLVSHCLWWYSSSWSRSI